MTEPKLKQCPFCGAHMVAKFVDRYGMHHPAGPCHLAGYRVVAAVGYDYGDTSRVEWDQDDVAWWNTRAAE